MRPVEGLQVDSNDPIGTQRLDLNNAHFVEEEVITQAVFFQLATPFPEVQQRAYASAFILLVIVLSLSVASRLLTRKASAYVIK